MGVPLCTERGSSSLVFHCETRTVFTTPVLHRDIIATMNRRLSAAVSCPAVIFDLTTTL
jgi:hypothetical protein